MLDWPNELAKRMVNKDVGLARCMDAMPAGLGYCPVRVQLELMTNSVLTVGLV